MLLLCALLACAQMAQNPSPMEDTTRAHRRLPRAEPGGRRWTLSLGTLFLPAAAGRTLPLLVHFHGPAWLAETSSVKTDRRRAVLAVQLGSGSAVYARAFAGATRFPELLEEAARAIDPAHPPQFHPLVLSSFSAGYGAIREILRVRENWTRIDAVVLADSLHTGYTPERRLDPDPLQVFAGFAREAAAGRKRMLVTHSEVYPGTFASTTETADFLLAALGLKRRAALKWGPGGMQQLSEARAGRFRLLGYAGNSAPDHLDHLHALASWLRSAR